MAIFKDIPRFDDTGITEYYRVNDGKVVKLSSDYDSLDDKPTINGVTIEGDLTTETLNIPIGNMEELRTNIKDNLVNAINELSIETESFANSITDKVNSIISFTILWVEVLPADENAKKNTVYLVPKKSMIEDNNYCEEYLYTDHGWEKIGDTKVDLSGYYTKTETDDIVETMMGQIQITYATRAEVNQSISNLTQSTNQSIANLSQEIHNTIGDMTTLDTDAKNTIVEALNELQAEVNAVGTPILFTGDYFHIDTQPAGNYYFGGNTKGYGWSGWIGVNTGMTGSYAEMVVVDDNTRFARIFNTRNEQTIIGKINGQYYNFTGEFLTGDEQYINGQKTFYDIPYIGGQYSPLTPTENSHAANKKYVDDAIKTGIDSIDDNIYRIVLTTNTRSNTGNGSSNLNATDRQAYANWLKWYQSKLGTPTVLEFYCTGNYFGAPSGTHKHLLGRIEFNGGAFTANKDICVTGMYAYNSNGSTMDTISGKVGDPVYTIYVTRVYFRTDIDSNGNYIPHSAFNGTYTTCPSTFGDADYQNSRIDIRTWLNTVAYTPTGDYNAATKKYVDDSITSAIGDIVSFGVELVDELPTENISTSTVYMVPAAEAGDQNIREEYLYTEHGWEMVGSTQINLENYYATEDEVLNVLYPQTGGAING